VSHGPLALIVDRSNGLDNAQRGFMVLRRLDQRDRVFGKTRSTIAGPCVQKFCSNAIIEANTASNVLHIDAQLLTKVRYFVDKGDLGG
jgi:hypothetical protein